jgi:outer membrane protein OmpA-like peptidoglycan-associated protein
MTAKWRKCGTVSLVFLAAACAPKQVQAPPPAPPQARQNILVLLPDPDGNPTSITITNSAGAQTVSQPYQVIRVVQSDTAPNPAVAMDQAEVRRVFGSVLDALPAPAVAFTAYFAEGSDVLAPEDQAELAAILKAIQERRSTAISVIGHTDTTANPQFNYQLGLRRAQGVATILRQRGVDASALSVVSHGDSDLAVKTPRGVSERRNRRVEVIVE